MKNKFAAFALAVCISGMAGCAQATALAAPVPVVENERLVWTAVDGAEKYVVTVNGEQFETDGTEYAFTMTQAGVYEVYVTAVGNGKTHTSEKVSYTVTAALSAPLLTLSGNVVSWEPVTGASGYEVYVNEERKTDVAECRYSVAETEIGEYSVKVKAKGEGVYLTSDFSNEVVFAVTEGAPTIKQLAAPVISLEQRTLTWNKVENAESYKVYVDGTEYASVKEESYILPIREEGRYAVTVCALNPSSDYTASGFSNEVVFEAEAFDLSKPVVAYIYGNGSTAEYSEEEGFLVQSGAYDDAALDSAFLTRAWRLEAEGEYYRIKLSDGTYLTSAAGASSVWCEAYGGEDGQLWRLEKTDDGWYILNKAVGDYLLCADSDSSKIHFWGYADSALQIWKLFNVDVAFGADKAVLETPVLTLSDNVVSWTAVNGAEGYRVYVNGSYKETVTDVSYTIAAEMEGLYSVKVKAVGGGYVSSMYSDSVEYMYTLLDLSRPVFASYKTNSGKIYAAGTDDEGFVVMRDADTISDFSPYMWYLEKDGEYYNVRLANGWYLTRVPNGASGAEARALPKSGEANQRWKLVAAGRDEYKLQNAEHMEQWGDRYYYGEWYGVFKFADACTAWSFENKDIPPASVVKLDAPTVSLSGRVVSWNAVENALSYEVYADGVLAATVTDTSYTIGDVEKAAVRVKAIGGEGYESSYLSNEAIYSDAVAALFSKPVVAYYNDANQTLGKLAEDGTLAVGEKYDSVADYADYLWTVERITADGKNYYMIRLPNGKYLSHYDNPASGEVAQTRAEEKDASDSRQWWNFVADGTDGNRFKLQNVYFSAYYPNVYLGEWYGVYKYNGGCQSWTFFNPA